MVQRELTVSKDSLQLFWPQVLSSDQTLADTLKDEGYSVYVIGDALAPRSIQEAIEEGGKIANVTAG